MATEASSLQSMIAEARQMQDNGQYVNGQVFHALADEIDKLQAALKPFADAGSGLSAKYGDLPGALSNISMDHLLRAAAAVGNIKPKTDINGVTLNPEATQ